MPEQLLLPGIEAPARPTDRLFFALQPGAETAQRVAALAQALRDQQGLKGKPLKTQHFHVTLHFLGDHLELPEAVVRTACEAAARVVQPPFQIVFDRVASFHNTRRLQPLVLRCGDEPSPVMAFRQTLTDALKRAGLARLVDARFTPHLTLLYDARLVSSQRIEPISWIATEFVLIHSLIGKTRHIPLGRWPLRC